MMQSGHERAYTLSLSRINECNYCACLFEHVDYGKCRRLQKANGEKQEAAIKEGTVWAERQRTTSAALFI